MNHAIETNDAKKMLLGQALIKKGILTDSELDMALAIQGQGEKRYLGEILLFMGFRQDEINTALDCLNKRRRIGDILIDQGIITTETLKHHLKEQKRIQSRMGCRIPLGILLAQLRVINYREYMRALSKHFVLPIASLEHYNILPSLQTVLGRKVIYESDALILKTDKKKIEIALKAPSLLLMQEIRKTIPEDKHIVFLLAHHFEIESVQKKLFHSLPS